MTNLQLFNSVFESALEIPVDEIYQARYKTTPTWDSVAQIAIIGGLENAFKITISADDILALSSYETGKSLIKKYGVIL